MSGKNENIIPALNFKSSDFVVSPSHGLGVVNSIEKVSAGDSKMDCYKIIFYQDKVTFFAPVNKVMDIGIRKISSKETVQKFFDVLAKPAKQARGAWGRRLQEYKAKMMSTSLLLGGEVLRDLYLQVSGPSPSYTEKMTYDAALKRIVAECSAVLFGSISDENIAKMEEKVIGILALTNKNKKLKTMRKKDDFEDEDDLEKLEDDADEDEAAA